MILLARIITHHSRIHWRVSDGWFFIPKLRHGYMQFAVFSLRNRLNHRELVHVGQVIHASASHSRFSSFRAGSFQFWTCVFRTLKPTSWQTNKQLTRQHRDVTIWSWLLVRKWIDLFPTLLVVSYMERVVFLSSTTCLVSNVVYAYDSGNRRFMEHLSVEAILFSSLQIATSKKLTDGHIEGNFFLLLDNAGRLPFLPVFRWIVRLCFLWAQRTL